MLQKPGPVRTAIIKKPTNKYWRGCGEKGTLLVGMSTGIAAMKEDLEIPFKKLTIELPNDPAVSSLGIYLQKTEL